MRAGSTTWKTLDRSSSNMQEALKVEKGGQGGNKRTTPSRTHSSFLFSPTKLPWFVSSMTFDLCIADYQQRYAGMPPAASPAPPPASAVYSRGVISGRACLFSRQDCLDWFIVTAGNKRSRSGWGRCFSWPGPSESFIKPFPNFHCKFTQPSTAAFV